MIVIFYLRFLTRSFFQRIARKGGDCNYNWDDIFKNPYNEANLRVDLTTALYVNRWEKARVRDRLVGIRESLWECCACVEP